MDQEEIKMENEAIKKRTQDRYKKGRDTEDFVYKIMLSLKEENKISEIKSIPDMKHKMDIIFKFSNEDFYRGLQVKTLVKNTNCIDGYSVHYVGKFQLDDVLVAISENRKRFVIFKRGDISNTRTVNFNFTQTNGMFNSKRRDYMRNTKSGFKELLTEYLYICNKFDINDLPPNMLIEYKANIEIEKKANEMKLEFKNYDCYNIVDFSINNHNVQLKSTTIHKSGLLIFMLSCKKEGRRTSYSSNDNIDFFMFKFTSEELCISRVWIIPFSAIKERNKIDTDKLEHIIIYMNKDEWYSKYENGWEQFKETKYCNIEFEDEIAQKAI